MGRGTSLNNQITFLNPLTEGNEVNEETPVEHEMLCQAVSEMMQGLVDGDEGGQKADDGGRRTGQGDDSLCNGGRWQLCKLILDYRAETPSRRELFECNLFSLEFYATFLLK